MPGDQVQVMDKIIGEHPLHTLVDAHTPEAHGRGGLRKGTGRAVNLLYRHTADFRHFFRPVFSRKAL